MNDQQVLRSRKPGTKVHYIPYDGADKNQFENGIIKSCCESDSNIVYVVYHCNGEWNRYKEFTAQATFVGDLREGWV